MSIKMWNGPTSGWIDGNVTVSPGGTGALVQGTVKMWPWIGAETPGGENVVSGLRYPVYAANRFGREEWPGNTAVAANQLFTSEVLAGNADRIVGTCDVRTLPGTTGAASLALTYNELPAGVSTAAQWATGAQDSPIVGGASAPNSFWDNATYPSQSVAKQWVGKRVIVVRTMDTTAAANLQTWIADNDAGIHMLAASSDISVCESFASSGQKCLYETVNGYPGDGTHPSVETLTTTHNVYGILIPAGEVNQQIVSQCALYGLYVWSYVAASYDAAVALANLGVHGIYTNTPSSVANLPLPQYPDVPPPDPDPGPDPDPEPPPPPTGAPANIGTWFGYGNDTGKTPNGIDGQMGRGLRAPGVVRHFTGSGTAEGLSSNVLGSGYNLWVSWKPGADTGMKNPGSWVPNSISYLKSRVGKSVACFMTVWHEPEGTSDRGSNSLSQWIVLWQNAQAALWDACAQARLEGYKFYVAPIICDWTFTDTSKGSAQQWYSSNFVKYDLMGFDVYPVGQKASGSNMIARLAMNSDYNVKPYADNNRRDTYNYNRRCAELARLRNRPWGSGETGLIRGKELGGDSLYKYSKAQRAQRFRDIGLDVLSLPNPPRLWCWYSHGGCAIVDEPDNESIAAWNETLRTNPTTVPRP